MLTRSFSSKPPSLAPAALVVMPGKRARESATFLSGILPMSSAVITSVSLRGVALHLERYIERFSDPGNDDFVERVDFGGRSRQRQ